MSWLPCLSANGSDTPGTRFKPSGITASPSCLWAIRRVFPRSQGGRGQVLIGGTSCPVIGTVNMNMLAVDITETEGVQPGDEVVLIGHQGDREISVGAFSERTKAFNYETLACSIARPGTARDRAVPLSSYRLPALLPFRCSLRL
ncbi:MAG: alanine racemase C-terminal domain-containing protein [Planctomycetota bacterium]